MKNHIKVSGIFLAALITACAHAQSKGIAIVGAKVETATGVAEETTVAFKDGKITYIGKEAPPTGYETRDGKGLWIVAGLMDAAMTRGLRLPDPIANEARDDSTTAPFALRPLNRKGIRPELVAADHLDLKLALESTREAGFSSALILPPSGTLRGQGSAVWLDEGEKDAVVLAASVGQGAAFTSGPGPGYPGSPFGVIALFRQTMLDAQRYQLFPANAKPKEHEPLGSLAAVLKGEKPMFWHAESKNEIFRAMQLSDEFKTKLVVVGGREAWRHTDALRARKATVIVNLNIGSEPRQSNDPDNQLPEAYLKERQELWREGSMNVLRLHEAKVPFAFGSIGDGSGNFLGNVRTLVGLGLPRKAALSAMTEMPAKIAGLESQLGSLTVGKRASITVFSADPFAADSVVRMIVINGKVVEVSK